MNNDEDLLVALSTSAPQRLNYTIYLLTVWVTEREADDPRQWRFRLENPRTKEGKGFVGVEELIKGLVETIRHP